MHPGRLDVCLRVMNCSSSIAYYRRLGFEPVEGNPSDGWTVVAHGVTRIGLFEPQFMESGAFSLNFRGGNIRSIARLLELDAARFVGDRGAGSASAFDPDGHAIFFDTAEDELIENA